MPLFTFGLGTWQLQRLQWKLDMIDQLENKLHKEPVRLPARIEYVQLPSPVFPLVHSRSLSFAVCSPAAIPEFAYRKVFVTGVYDHDHELEMGPRTRDGELGYHVVTPLVRGEGQDTIMVNRGFVKREKRDQSERPASIVRKMSVWGGAGMLTALVQTKERVEVVGMLRDQEKPNSFTPANSPEKGEWIFNNIEEMSQHTGAEPVLVDEIFSASSLVLRIGEGTFANDSAS